MGNIISVYLAREILKTSAATLLILFVILISNALGRVLADIADGDIPQQAMGPVLLSQSINLLALLLPISLFLGIVFALGRMYKDHEIVVMNACGVGYREFYKPVLMLLLPIALFSAYTSLWLNAQVQTYAQSIVDHEENQHEFQQIKAGQFNQSDAGQHVIFMESISNDRLELRNIIISQSSEDKMILETAQTGRQKIDEVSGNLFLVVGPGQRYEAQAGSNNHRVIEFDQHGIWLKKKNKSVRGEPRSESKLPAELWNSKLLDDRVEFHWRVAIPVVLIVLALLAVPLSYIAPRQGRFGKVGYALLVFIIYLNLLALTRAQLESGTFPLLTNFWWVHLLFLAITVSLLWRRNRGFRRGLQSP